jgi:hypothetical protein
MVFSAEKRLFLVERYLKTESFKKKQWLQPPIDLDVQHEQTP